MLAQLGEWQLGASLIAQREPEPLASKGLEARRARRADVMLTHVPVARQTVERLLDSSRWPFES